MRIHYKNSEKIFQEVDYTVSDALSDDITYLRFPLLDQTGLVRQGFSTKLGGVSKGVYSSMNLGVNTGDLKSNIKENYERFCKAIGVKVEDLVLSQQTHTNNVRIITEEDKGNGIIYPQKFHDVDGMITNVPHICLVTFYADCVPLYFLDPVKKVIGLSHSGWRGTVGKIGRNTIEQMNKSYGSDPKDILATIGPSICQECYEVSEDVIERFKQNFDKKYWSELFYQKENGKYQLDLWKANEIIFLESDILPEHIGVTNVCTHCNSEIFYSHRTMGRERGSLCAFLSLK